MSSPASVESRTIERRHRTGKAILHKRRILNSVTIGLLLGILGAALLIAGGAFDPQVRGEPAAAVAPGTVTIGAGETTDEWPLRLPREADAFSLILDARFGSGEVDSAAGVGVRGPGGACFAATSPAGYVGIWAQRGEERDVLFPWQMWPHVRPAENEIWIESRDGRWTVRINRELLWIGAVPAACAAEADEAGHMRQSWGKAAEYDLHRLTLFVMGAE